MHQRSEVMENIADVRLSGSGPETILYIKTFEIND